MASYPRVDEYMSSPVVVVKPSDNLAHVRNLMIRYRVGRLVVIDDNNRPIGIVTKTDFLKVASGSLASRPLDSVFVREIMTGDVVTITQGRSLREAARLMLQHNIGGLPVVDEEGRLVGIITKTDIVRAYAERLRGKYKASDFMYSDVPKAAPSHSVSYVIDLLYSHPSRRVLVVDSGEIVGIIAPSDIAFLAEYPSVSRTKSKSVRRFAELPKGRLGPVYEYTIITAQDVMTPDPITVAEDSDLAEAAKLMIRHGFSSVPVVGEKEPLGVVVKHNILQAIAQSK
ncbi:CBS domain-containing protein [Pyrofollis japonicus]|uniref:CBS domain-containing protein n=1 Tax=Pyrofollis japonicus TaxID=3060460 RepID=UPI00295BC657|nr:CBS domain-containing protein [Pyrofollis japonicus]BEP17128.1 CBS domain-containing protein [Pyrofollis japonicus]